MKDEKIGFTRSGGFEVNTDPKFQPTELDYLAVQEAMAMYGDWRTIPVHLIVAEEDYGKAIGIQERNSKIVEEKENLELITLSCPSCGNPLSDTSCIYCNSCKNFIFWNLPENPFVLSLQTQIFYLLQHEQFIGERYRLLVEDPGVLQEKIAIQRMCVDKLHQLALEIKKCFHDNPNLKKNEVSFALSCPSCGSPLKELNHCDSCNTIIVYSRYSIKEMESCSDEELAEFIKKKKDLFLLLEKQFAIVDGKISSYGNVFFANAELQKSWLFLKNIYEKTRVELLNALYAKNRHNQSSFAPELHDDKIENLLHIQSAVLTPKCPNCGANPESNIHSKTNEVGNICYCPYCTMAINYGDQEFTHTITQMEYERVQQKITNTERLLQIFLELRKRISAWTISEWIQYYRDQKSLDGGRYQEAISRYSRLIDDANNLIQKLNSLFLTNYQQFEIKRELIEEVKE